jgi:hypothetical protein
LSCIGSDCDAIRWSPSLQFCAVGTTVGLQCSLGSS